MTRSYVVTPLDAPQYNPPIANPNPLLKYKLLTPLMHDAHRPVIVEAPMRQRPSARSCAESESTDSM